MAICRFLARELGIAGNNNSEAARVDEIVDAIQDAVDATVSRIFLETKYEWIAPFLSRRLEYFLDFQ